ncbi:MAG: hypothetical protein NVV83_12460 [Afipia sp.]|nr:hypothetical protein [Afipia sp.]
MLIRQRRAEGAAHIPDLQRRCFAVSSLPGLTRQSIFLNEFLQMDARVKPRMTIKIVIASEAK